MPEKTLEKIAAWLKYQEDVFGRFQLPAGEHHGDKLTADPQSILGNKSSASSVTIQATQPTQLNQTNQASQSNKSTQPSQSDPAIRTMHTSPEDPGLTETKTNTHKPGSPEGNRIPGTNPLKNLHQCTDLATLKSLCEQSSELKTDLAGTNLVFGTGNPDADLMLIGEAPGEREDLQGEPFVGKAGQLLNKILKAIGFDREQVYIANILKHRPPNNRDPLPEERIKSLPFLEKQIDLINPKLILCLGRISAQTLLETSAPMKDLRGRFHPYRGYELMVTYHPAALLRNPNWKRGTWEDVQLLRKRYNELGGKP